MMIPTENNNQAAFHENPPIDWRRYMALLCQWWWVMALAVLLFGAAGYLISRQMTPIYQASTTLLVNQAPSDKAADYNTILTSERLAQTYARMIARRPVLEKAIARISARTTPEDLARIVTVTPVRDTQLITVSVESPDAGFSAAVANAIAVIFSDQIQEMQSTRYAGSKASLKAQMDNAESQAALLRGQIKAAKDPGEIAALQTRLNQFEQIYATMLASYEQIRLADAQSSSSVVQVEKAITPSRPVKPKTALNTVLATLVGLMLSAGGLLAYDALDDTIKSPDAVIRSLGLPLIGVIPRFVQPKDGALIAHAQPYSTAAESFRAMRTYVQYLSVDTPPRVLMVTSPAPADGKTTVVANLAVTIAQGGRRVTVVDADLHRPRLHSAFDAASQPGLSDLFVQPGGQLDGALQPTPLETLRLVASGGLPPNPSELLGSNKMREILGVIQAGSDLVLLDTPPVLSVTDALVLAPVVDGVLLVVRPGETKMRALKAAVDQLRFVKANLAGVVFNAVEQKHSRYGYYYHGYYYHRDKARRES